MRPSWNPRRGNSDLELEQKQNNQRNEDLVDFYHGLKQIISNVPCAKVPYPIIRNVAKLVTFTKDKAIDGWKDLVSELASEPMDSTSLTELEYWSSRDQEQVLPLEMFLTKKFSGSFNNLIEVLILKEQFQTLLKIQDAVKEFISSLEFGKHNNQSSSFQPRFDPKGDPEDDSGVFDQSINSSTHNSEINEDHISTACCISQNVQPNEISYQRNKTTKDILKCSRPIYPVFQDFPLSLNSTRSVENLRNGIFPNEVINSTINPITEPDFQNNEFDAHSIFQAKFPFSKTGESVNVFIPHAGNDEDESVARALAARLQEDFHFDTMVLRDADSWLQTDTPEFIFNILQEVDFIVPILSDAYLQEIRPTGNPNHFTTDRLNVRYFHAVCQGRILNMNSLNFLIRPVMVEGVLPGKVRNWLEFQMPLRYPNEIPRLARNLVNTKRKIEAARMAQQVA